jgi:AAA+ ATPase superfamily predicted ATPase
VPFGVSQRSSKKSLYRIADQFLAFWFRFVEPNRSRLESRTMVGIEREIRSGIAGHHADVWEKLVRRSVPRLRIEGIEWQSAHRWWGGGTDKSRLEVDVVAESSDRTALLLGESKLTIDAEGLMRARQNLQRKAARLPFVKNYRRVVERVFAVQAGRNRGPDLVTAEEVFGVLK